MFYLFRDKDTQVYMNSNRLNMKSKMAIDIMEDLS